MSVLNDLEGSGAKCELCAVTDDLNIYEVPPVPIEGVDRSLLGCTTCIAI
ncbi:hypothetical protein MNBD_BACTEROID03-1127 [hydrothermal vent metagenome]|uniref:PhnA protein N-terminal proteobacterial domain-containing protein n=1 Tax=hydrothermal vent metagenome TaxID=652676 RepID=A0A3B0T583_9ZZZZ